MADKERHTTHTNPCLKKENQSSKNQSMNKTSNILLYVKNMARTRKQFEIQNLKYTKILHECYTEIKMFAVTELSRTQE